MQLPKSDYPTLNPLSQAPFSAFRAGEGLAGSGSAVWISRAAGDMGTAASGSYGSTVTAVRRVELGVSTPKWMLAYSIPSAKIVRLLYYNYCHQKITVSDSSGSI